MIVARAFAPRTPKWKYAKRAVRSAQLGPRDARRRHRRRQPPHAGSGSRISGVAPKAYLGNYKVLTVPSALRAERELGGDRRRHRGRGPRRDGRDQPLARRGGDRAEPRHRRCGARRSSRRRSRAGRRRRQQLRRARRGIGHLARKLGPRDHGRRRKRGRAAQRSRSFSSGRAHPALATHEARRDGPWRRRPLVRSAPRRALGGCSAARAWPRPTSRARPLSCTSAIRPGRLRRSSRRSCRPASRCSEARSRPSRHARAAGPSTSSAPTRRCSSRRRPGSRSGTSRREGPPSGRVTLTDAGGGAGQWAVTTSLQQPAGGVSFSAPSRHGPGRARRDGDRGTGLDPGQPHRLRRAHARHDRRRIPYWLRVSAPALARRADDASHAHGHVQGQHPRTTGARRVVPLPRGPPRPRRPARPVRPGAGVPGLAEEAGRELRRRRHRRPSRRPASGGPRRRREPTARRDRAPVQRESVHHQLRQAGARRRRGASRSGRLRHRLRHAQRLARRPVHVPLLDRRHDASAAEVPVGTRRRRQGLAHATTERGSIGARSGSSSMGVRRSTRYDARRRADRHHW